MVRERIIPAEISNTIWLCIHKKEVFPAAVLPAQAEDQDRAGRQPRESLLSFSCMDGKCRSQGHPGHDGAAEAQEVDAAGILEKALKGYQVAAQTLTRFIQRNSFARPDSSIPNS